MTPPLARLVSMAGGGLTFDNLHIASQFREIIGRCGPDDARPENYNFHQTDRSPFQMPLHASVPARFDRPNIHQILTSHAVKPIEQIDRRIAMRRHKLDEPIQA